MKTEEIRLRVSPEEKATFQQAAELAGISLSAWVRERIRRAARSELSGAGQKVPFMNQTRAGHGPG